MTKIDFKHDILSLQPIKKIENLTPTCSQNILLRQVEQQKIEYNMYLRDI